jgi:hypothetical protein
MPLADVLVELERTRTLLSETVAAVAEGNLAFSEIVDAVDDRGYLYVVKVLEVVDGVGKVRARRMLADLGLVESVRISELHDTQRAALVAGL